MNIRLLSSAFGAENSTSILPVTSTIQTLDYGSRPRLMQRTTLTGTEVF
jgi:hypothetical protein